MQIHKATFLQELEDGERVVGGPRAAPERGRPLRRVRGAPPGAAGDGGQHEGEWRCLRITNNEIRISFSGT